MNVVAVIQADLDRSPPGTRSRLSDELVGVAVLRRTVARARQAKHLSAVHVLCPSAQQSRCERLLNESGAAIQPFDAKPAPWSELVQTARKWSLDGWRGGIGQTTSFDEYTDCRLLSELLKPMNADAVLCVPPGAALLDPALADRMIEHRQNTEEDVRFVFTQSPPGMAGILIDADLVQELAEKNIPIGWTLSYQPDNPKKDLTFEACCFEVPAVVRHAAGRLMADTQRSMQLMADLLRNNEFPDACDAGRWLTGRESTQIEPLPKEVEIELTTDDPYPETLLRPRGARIKARGPIDPTIIERVVDEVSRYDDALVVLGGFGDPLRHPNFATILKSFKTETRSGNRLYGLAIRTTAVDLTDELIHTMIDSGVDVLSVTLDAWSEELYSRLQSPKETYSVSLQEVVARLDRLAEVRGQRRSVKPIIVPEMTKARENVHELDDFHDGWLRKNGAVSITGFSHCACQIEDRSVINMAPSARVGCRRIRSRCMVLADGRVALCDQDVHGLHTVGSLMDQSLEEIWQGAAFAQVREAHRAGRFDPNPLCAACDDWHRP